MVKIYLVVNDFGPNKPPNKLPNKDQPYRHSCPPHTTHHTTHLREENENERSRRVHVEGLETTGEPQREQGTEHQTVQDEGERR